MKSRNHKLAADLLRILADNGPLTVAAMADLLEQRPFGSKKSVSQGSKSKERSKQKSQQRRLAGFLKQDGWLLAEGLISLNPSGRYVITQAGQEYLANPKAKSQQGSSAEPPLDASPALARAAETSVGSEAVVLSLAKPIEPLPPMLSGGREAAARDKSITSEEPQNSGPTLLSAASAELAQPRDKLTFALFCQRLKELRWRLILMTSAFVFIVFAGFLVGQEIRTSMIQAHVFAYVNAKLGFHVEKGPSEAIRFPRLGPYDERLGYSLMPKLIARAESKSYVIEEQARLSPWHLDLIDKGFYPIYREKDQTGLHILDASQNPLFQARYPQLIYDTFADVPPIIAQMLLYIENRELLDERYPYKNPTIEWGRLGRAVLDMMISKVLDDHDVPGGSTLATQIEKFRHSSEGRTSSVKDKFVQMGSATLRAYIDGAKNITSRQRVVLAYINSVPLGAVPGGGEVRGLGHGLVAWHGAHFQEVNDLLKDPDNPNDPPELRARKALAFKEVLSLFLSQRRPAYYLQSDREALKRLTDRYLKYLADADLISDDFASEIKKAQLTFRNNMIMFQPERLSFVERKAANAVRVHLLSLFGFDRLYSLDRLDLKATSTIDYETQSEVTSLLQKLKDPAFAQASGLVGHRLLERGDPSQVIYSFTLRERVGDSNVLRVQADNVDGPFNVNEGGKLELGSTAKLRTLVHYLEIIEILRHKYAEMKPEALAKVEMHPYDRLSQWMIEYFKSDKDRSLQAVLEAAMNRLYSANPYERFFTGGGSHRFSNFTSDDDGRIVTVAESLRKSINLPFVRMMRDLVYYHIAQIPGSYQMVSQPDNPLRLEYLRSFANKEGQEFLGRFYLQYRGMKRDIMLSAFLKKVRQTPKGMAALYVTLKPECTFEEFAEFLKQKLPEADLTPKVLDGLYEEFTSDKYSLHDRGYIAKVHPLELWLVSYMYRVPKANFSQIMEKSANQRLEVYSWLFNSRNKAGQDRRIQVMLEKEAFRKIHQFWQRVGFPFASLVPTYATALGSSGDRPAALAELMGVIINRGLRYPALRVTELHFAEGTPFETKLVSHSRPGERVMSQELASVVMKALAEVVEQGTAQRMKNAFIDDDGKALTVGGKTGTGDNRYQVYAPGGRVIESKAMSRTATFVFFIGERFFGTLTAYVPSNSAQTFSFTSALPVQILKILSPKLEPLVRRKEVHASNAEPQNPAAL